MSFTTMQPTHAEIALFLSEDIGGGDLTAGIIPESASASASVISRENFVLCGRDWFDEVFKQLNSAVSINWRHEDGEMVMADATLCTLQGPARALLSGERTALNLLQTLSATASIARRYANAVAGTGCKILDTRKTLPGLRLAQKYAVHCGGCSNHRIGLYDAILIKENHIIAAGSISAAVKTARQLSSALVEIEVENLDEFQQALAVTPDRILLDNFSLEDTKTAVQLNNNRLELEASGNITLENIRTIAQTGVNFISIGALTKNVTAIDLSMRIHMQAL
jgi:nicotinate-nucleotide pyrophosphorylase (carboxylating)